MCGVFIDVRGDLSTMLSRSWAAALGWLLIGFAAGPAQAGCKVSKVAELPVTVSDMQPLVPVKINGADVMLIADSGAFYSILSPSTASEQKLPKEDLPFGYTVVGIGGEADPYLTTVKTFTLAGVPIKNVAFIVSPGAGAGSQAAGLMGQNVLGLADVEYDLAHGIIRLMQAEGCSRKVALVYWEPAKTFSMIDIDPPTTPKPKSTIGEAYVNGVRIRVQFDTGAGDSMMTLKAARRAGIKIDGPDVKPGGFTWGVGKRMVNTWIAPISSFKIGDEEIRTTKIRIGDTDLMDTDMLVGADFFLSHHVYVANSQNRLYFTYNGGPVFNLTAKSLAQDGLNGTPKESTISTDGPEPKDASAFSRRGAALMSRRELERAIADFDKACAMAPTEPSYFYQRGMAHWQAEQRDLAMADLDKAVKLKPDQIDVLMARAELRLSGHDTAGAAADLDAADRAASKESDLRLELGDLYNRVDRLDAAVAQYDLWITSHDGDAHMTEALNDRCWDRALLGRDLDKALKDCDRAVRSSSKAAAVLDSRGLVHLRLGQYDKAVADYDAALAQQPKIAWSLYGRGLAKQRLGQKAAGQADLDAALALEPELPKKAQQYGIVEAAK